MPQGDATLIHGDMEEKDHGAKIDDMSMHACAWSSFSSVKIY
jgi:hypothetical protein